jgi:hypothetical protein
MTLPLRIVHAKATAAGEHPRTRGPCVTPRRGAQSLGKMLIGGLKAVCAVTRASKRKHRSRTMPALGAGLSLTLASEATLAATAPALDAMTRKAGVNHEIILREEEICDVSLATFYVFDKEEAGAVRAGARLMKVTGCCEFACLAGQAAQSNTYSPQVYSSPVPRPSRPPQRSVRKKR